MSNDIVDLFSDELFEFLNTKFPMHSNDLKESLQLLENVLQTTIDSIEDKSNEIVKTQRNFLEANKYRQKENSLHIITMKLQEIIDKLEIEAEEEYSEELINETNNQSYEDKATPNYSKYLVDTNIQHTLYEDFTHKRPVAFQLREEKYFIKDWKEMLLQICNILSEVDKNLMMSFPNNPQLNGKKVTYFAFKEEDIIRAPRKLKDLNLYVATNHSANSIRNIIINILRAYKIPLTDFKVYLRADYTELHD